MSTNTWYEKRQSMIEGCCRQLIAQETVEPLSTDEGETRDWNLRELASLIEGHFHVQLDVARLSEIERLAYEHRVSFDGGPLASPHNGYRLPFWLLDDGRRIGTSHATGGKRDPPLTFTSLSSSSTRRRREMQRRLGAGSQRCVRRRYSS